MADVPEECRARHPAEFGRAGRRSPGQEYRLPAEALRDRPGLLAGLRPCFASFPSRGRDAVPLRPRPSTLPGRVLPRLYGGGGVTSRP